MSGAIHLLRGGQAGGSRANDGDLVWGPRFGRFGDDPAFVESTFHDRLLDVLDRDRVFVYGEHARCLARRGTDAAREFREVVGSVQRVQRLAPLTGVN